MAVTVYKKVIPVIDTLTSIATGAGNLFVLFGVIWFLRKVFGGQSRRTDTVEKKSILLSVEELNEHQEAISQDIEDNIAYHRF